jgi:hypothetical protein
VVIDHFGLAPGMPLLSTPSFLGRTPGFPATSPLFVVFTARLFGLVTAAAFMMPGSTAGVGFDLGGVHLGTAPSALGALGFFLLGGVALRLFPCALSPSLGPTSLLLLLPTCFILLLLSPAPLPTLFVLSAARLLSGLLYRSIPGDFFLSPAGTTGSTACFPFGIRLLAPSPCFVVCCRIGSAATRLRARFQTGICLVSFRGLQAPKQ